jgi:hypothetical protein
LSGWKQTSGGAEMCELRPARPFVCRVVHPGQDADGAIEQAKAHKLAALRENGEAREIYFEEPEVVITDVPHSVQFGRY